MKYNIEDLLIELINTKKELHKAQKESDYWQGMFSAELDKTFDKKITYELELLVERDMWREVADGLFYAYIVGGNDDAKNQAFQAYLDACKENYNE